jgi:hypothetical protein
MSKEFLDVNQLARFLEWATNEFHGDQNLAVAKLLNLTRRKIICVSRGDLTTKDFDKWVQEFIDDVYSVKPGTCPGCKHMTHRANACFNMQPDGDCDCTLDSIADSLR